MFKSSDIKNIKLTLLACHQTEIKFKTNSLIVTNNCSVRCNDGNSCNIFMTSGSINSYNCWKHVWVTDVTYNIMKIIINLTFMQHNLPLHAKISFPGINKKHSHLLFPVYTILILNSKHATKKLNICIEIK